MIGQNFCPEPRVVGLSFDLAIDMIRSGDDSMIDARSGCAIALAMESKESPGPGGHIGGDQKGADGDDLARQACIVVVERPQEGVRHGTSIIGGPLAGPICWYDVLISNIIQR